MQSLLHRVRVFVYRYEPAGPEYLLLRRDQGIESFWTPIHGTVGLGEKLETAIRREVHSDAGLTRADELIDLDLTGHWVVGDEEVIEWHWGYRSGRSDEDVRLGAEWSDYRWTGFGDAYPSLEHEADRAAIMRLHTRLAG